MNDLQKELLKMFKWYHDFCTQYGLRYYIIGGTMLGAVRHKGFIPWDDDIDVGMPRADYEKLWKFLRENPHDRYVMETPQTKALDYFYLFSKIYDTQTTLIENTRLKIKRGIYLDIFPLDGIGNSKEESKRNSAPIYWKQNLLLARVTGIRAGRSKIKNAAVILARLIPDKILNNKRLLLGIEKACKQYDFDACSWVGNLVGAWRWKEIMPREYFGTPTPYEFEGYTVYGPQKANEYLTVLYGDWRKLPPKEKQVSHHDFIVCNLEKSFLHE